MNDIQMLRDHGPSAAPLTPAVYSTARAALIAELDAATAPHSELRPRRRRTRTRLLISSAAVAATVAALAIGGPAIGSGPGAPSAAAAVVLAPFVMPDFPVSLSSTPPGLAAPVLDGSPSRVTSFYNSLDPRSPDQVTLTVDSADPGWPSDGTVTVSTPQTVAVNGHDGQFVVLDYGLDSGTGMDIRSTVVRWQQRPGLWVSVGGSGSFTESRKLLDVANSVTFEAQPVALRLGLAPAGWHVDAFKDGGTILTMASDTDPDQTLTVDVPEEPIPVDALPTAVEDATGDLAELTINGRSAQLLPTGDGWFLQAAAPDGTVFTLQAPSSFSREQVIDVASQVTHQ